MSPSRCLIRYDDNEVVRRNTNTISTFKKNYSLGTHDTTIVSESDDLTNFDNAFDKGTTTKIDCSKVKATYLTSPMGNGFENMADFVFPANLSNISTSKGVLSGYGKKATGFVKMFPDRRGDFGVELLPENLYNQLSVFEAAVKSYLLVAAYLMIIGLILLVFSLFKRKTLGFIICGGMISLGMAFSAIRTNLMWTMPMANSITWLHYTKYFKKPIMPMSFSVIYLLVLIAVLLVFGGIAIGKFNYDNVTEVAS